MSTVFNSIYVYVRVCVSVPANTVFRPKGLAQDTNVSQAKLMSENTA